MRRSRWGLRGVLDGAERGIGWGCGGKQERGSLMAVVQHAKQQVRAEGGVDGAVGAGWRHVIQ